VIAKTHAKNISVHCKRYQCIFSTDL